MRQYGLDLKRIVFEAAERDAVDDMKGLATSLYVQVYSAQSCVISSSDPKPESLQSKLMEDKVSWK